MAADDSDRVRRLKAELFKALGHPLRIHILELLRGGPMSVTSIQAAVGAPASSVSQLLAVLRARNIVETERRGTTILYRVADAELFELLDAARRVLNAHLSGTADLLWLVEREEAAPGASGVDGERASERRRSDAPAAATRRG